MVRPRTADEAEFEIEVHPEDTPIAGNCSASDADTHGATEAWIEEQLDNGTAWGGDVRHRGLSVPSGFPNYV